MTFAYVTIGVLVLVVAALLYVLDRTQERHTDERLQAERQWAKERRELITRALRPDLVPVPRAPRMAGESKVERSTDEIAKVGTLALARDAMED